MASRDRPEEGSTDRIAALEQELDAALPDRRARGLLRAWLPIARSWSQAVWAKAEADGPPGLAAGIRKRGLALAHRPVFICGAHRSGTNLVRHLLDGHPALSVLPSEGSWLTNLKPRLDALPAAECLPELGQEWLRRLANPMNQPPYWLLGRTTASHSPYVGFARALLAWHAVLEKNGARPCMLPHVAVALAYAQCRPDGVAAPSVWVDKTPTNERFLATLRNEFPAARIIHVVRRPEAVLASMRGLTGRADWRVISATLRDLAFSYRVALEQSDSGRAESWLLVRYEDLVRDPAAEMERVRAFLGIDAAPILLRPTLAGLPASNNSSFPDLPSPPGTIRSSPPDRTAALGRLDRLRLAASVGGLAPRLGYPMALPFGTTAVRAIQALLRR